MREKLLESRKMQTIKTDEPEEETIKIKTDKNRREIAEAKQKKCM